MEKRTEKEMKIFMKLKPFFHAANIVLLVVFSYILILLECSLIDISVHYGDGVNFTTVLMCVLLDIIIAISCLYYGVSKS